MNNTMKNLKDEIEGILGRNGIYNYRKTYVYSSAEDARANRAMGTEVEQLPVIKELTSLIEQEKERAVKEFLTWFNQRDIDGVEVLIDLNLVEQYLAERKS